MRARTKLPVTPGHKCAGALLGVCVQCECGWSSATWYGKGSRSSAYGEWRGHVEKCTTPKKASYEGADLEVEAERRALDRLRTEHVA